MSQHITKAADIPQTPYYVLSNDTFMSGWGEAKGLINTVILPCATWLEAWDVMRYARSRTDTSFVRITTRTPRIRSGHYYSLFSRADAPAWYDAD